MRYSASEKAEIIGLVEGSHLPAKANSNSSASRAHLLLRVRDRYLTGAPRRWLTTARGRIASGTAFPPRCATRSSSWRWRSRKLSPREIAVRFTDSGSTL